jgi:hypothetical protein
MDTRGVATDQGYSVSKGGTLPIGAELARAIVRAIRPIILLGNAELGGSFRADGTFVLTVSEGGQKFLVVMDDKIAVDAYALHKDGESEYLVSLVSFISWSAGEDVPWGQTLHIGFGFA